MFAQNLSAILSTKYFSGRFFFCSVGLVFTFFCESIEASLLQCLFVCFRIASMNINESQRNIISNYWTLSVNKFGNEFCSPLLLSSFDCFLCSSVWDLPRQFNQGLKHSFVDYFWLVSKNSMFELYIHTKLIPSTFSIKSTVDEISIKKNRPSGVIHVRSIKKCFHS